MKGAIGTPMILSKGPKPKQKFKARKVFFCVVCRGWITKGQWFNFVRQGRAAKHAYKSDCIKQDKQQP